MDTTLKQLAGWRPQAEGFVPGILRAYLPSYVRVTSRIEEGAEFPFVEVSSSRVSEGSVRDDRHLQVVNFTIHSFCQGVDAEEDAANLCWSCVNAVLEAGKRGDKLPDGSIVATADLFMPPLRRSDWADASGPVQYQDLPQLVERFEATMKVVLLNRNL